MPPDPVILPLTECPEPVVEGDDDDLSLGENVGRVQGRVSQVEVFPVDVHEDWVEAVAIVTPQTIRDLREPEAEGKKHHYRYRMKKQAPYLFY